MRGTGKDPGSPRILRLTHRHSKTRHTARGERGREIEEVGYVKKKKRSGSFDEEDLGMLEKSGDYSLNPGFFFFFFFF